MKRQQLGTSYALESLILVIYVVVLYIRNSVRVVLLKVLYM